jgi:hypothetical protein
METPIRPPVIFWYKVYCAFMTVLYLLAVVMCVLCFVTFVSDAEVRESGVEYIVASVLLIAVNLAFLLPNIVALFLRPRPWVWIYGLVIICLGMHSCCWLPACVALLIFWFKPETKAYFGWK